MIMNIVRRVAGLITEDPDTFNESLTFDQGNIVPYIYVTNLNEFKKAPKSKYDDEDDEFGLGFNDWTGGATQPELIVQAETVQLARQVFAEREGGHTFTKLGVRSETGGKFIGFLGFGMADEAPMFMTYDQVMLGQKYKDRLVNEKDGMFDVEPFDEAMIQEIEVVNANSMNYRDEEDLAQEAGFYDFDDLYHGDGYDINRGANWGDW